VNDVSHNLSADSVANALGELIDIIRRRSPETRLYVESLLPINNSFGRYKLMKDKEQVIRDINSRLEVIATSKGCTWLNVYPIFCDENQNLKREWTNDGLHLLAPGYLVWRDFLLPYVNE
jgi:lysophospholipase L1-like esterase